METKNKGELMDEMLDDEEEDTQANKYLFFRIDRESYGIEIRHIIEIVELQRISMVPDMPAYVKGVINLRGKVIPVVDLRLRFGMNERPYDDRTCIVGQRNRGCQSGVYRRHGGRGPGNSGEPSGAGTPIQNRIGAGSLYPRHGEGRRGC